MIKINNLTKKYKDKLAVDNLNLEIKTGELFSLLGTNGAGKTTTIKMLSTLILPTGGTITINDLDIFQNKFKSLSNFKTVALTLEDDCKKLFINRFLC